MIGGVNVVMLLQLVMFYEEERDIMTEATSPWMRCDVLPCCFR